MHSLPRKIPSHSFPIPPVPAFFCTMLRGVSENIRLNHESYTLEEKPALFASTLVVGRHLCCCCFLFDRTLEGWALSVVVVPGVSSPKGSSCSVPRVSPPRRSSSLVLGVLSPKGIWGIQCCRVCQRIVPRGFVPHGKLGRPMLPSSQANCALGFRPPREAGAADVATLASELCLGFTFPKGSWGGVNDAALAGG